jgi:hypothetical protein
MEFLFCLLGDVIFVLSLVVFILVFSNLSKCYLFVFYIEIIIYYTYIILMLYIYYII